jgi:hypothetical protein
MPSRRRSGSCGPSAARGAAVGLLPPSDTNAASYFLGSFGKLLTPPTRTPSAEFCSVTSSASAGRVKAGGGVSRDRKCVIVPAVAGATSACSCEHKKEYKKCVKTVRFETVDEDNLTNEHIAVALRTEAEFCSVMDPLYATVRKRNNPPEQPQQQRPINMPQAPLPESYAGREEGFRPYRSFRQKNTNCHQQQQSLDTSQHQLHQHRDNARRYNSSQQQQWHVRQNTEIWSGGYKVN